MPTPQKNWQIQEPHLDLQKKLSDALDVHPVIAQLLINRNITDLDAARQFLHADMASLHDPFLLKNMEKAVERIREAVSLNQKVLVFGDYDVDGVTSSVLLNGILTSMGVDVIHHIPHRMTEGYGLNHAIAEKAKDQNVDLLITVDCGVTACDEVATINRHGIDVIIIDHHEPLEDRLPDAYAVINPKQKDCPYPFKHLAAVGLVSKVIQALEGEISGDVLHFAAIGTVADVAPLHGENRILVKSGLAGLNKTKNPGLLALMDMAKITGKPISPFHIGFVLGPRINAAGRMDSAHSSLDLFLAKDMGAARALARVLEDFNQSRQKMQRDVIEDALSLVEDNEEMKDQKIIVLGKEGWHKGVLGIVASKIADKYCRPAIVISIENGIGTASARSIDGFHLHDAIQNCADLLEEFGGHKAAAGLTIKEENIEPFRTQINNAARETLDVERMKPTLAIDGEITFEDISMDLANTVDSLAPYGEGNPTPLFCCRNLIAKSYARVLGRNTLKFWVTDGRSTISAVGFGMGDYQEMVSPGQRLDLAFQIGIDDWNKAPTPQIMLKDIRPTQG